MACEGLDSRIVDVVRAQRGSAPDLPRGAGWLFAEVTAATRAEAESLAGAVLGDAGAVDGRVVADPAEMAALWRIREDGAGLAARSLARPAYSGWEDAAVPPARLGAYLREFDDLLRHYDLDGVPYGHFGDGCVHVRIDFEFADQGRRFREFLLDSARMVATYGGSLSGEHGDGRARSELLPLMYDEQSIRLFGAVKEICDPDDLLNPGVLVDPAPVDADLRPGRSVHAPRTLLRLTHDAGSLGDAVHRCTGVGKCRADATGRRRGHVPVVPRDQGGEGLHPGAGPGASGGPRRDPGRRARRPGRGRGARSVPVLQGLCPGLPHRHRHGDLQVGGAAPEVRGQSAPSLALHAGPAADVGPAGRTGGAAAEPGC